MTLIEITQGLDVAVKTVYEKRDKLEAIKKQVAAAEEDYAKAMASVKDLHAQYSSYMGNILTNFGQLHK
jgi:t-SNARE complex subunit (syntaxin)